MSRMYRIRVSESDRRVIRASDHVRTQLEILEILPEAEMAELLKEQLLAAGFTEDEDGMLVRGKGNVSIRVDPATATVSVESEIAEDVELTTEKIGNYYDETPLETRKQTAERLREAAKQELDEEEARQTEKLQQEATDRLEAELLDVQAELNGIVNRATAGALKLKASRIGQIKELTEDPQSGSMTIVLEV